MSHLRLIAATCIATSVVVLPAVAFAQTISDLQTELQSLLTEIAQLQQSTSSTQPASVTTTNTSAAVATSNIICPTIVRTLALGSSGTDVANLQGFLAQNPLIYPEQSVTGYFNTLTQDAVQRWQTAYGVITSGTPATTGYGVVGPRTRAAIVASCANSTNGQNTTFTVTNSTSKSLCPIAPQPATACLGTWSPLTNATGCTIAWQCSVPLSLITGSSTITSTAPTLTANISQNSPYTVQFNGSNFSAGLYTIDFGDGIFRTQTVTVICSTTSGSQSSSCGTFSTPHVYVTGGTYLAKIVSSSGTTIASTYVYIAEPIVTYTNSQVTYTSSPITFSAAPSAFTKLPDQVTFTATNLPSPTSSYSINFGDGSSYGNVWSSSSATTFTQSHAYTSTGTFTVSLVDPSGASIISFTVTINSSSTGAAPVISSITPTSGPNGTFVTITGSGFTSGVSACGQGCTGGGLTNGNEINIDGQALENDQATNNGTIISFTVGMNCSSSAPSIPCSTSISSENDPLTAGTHQITITNANGTSNSVTFTVTGPTPPYSAKPVIYLYPTKTEQVNVKVDPIDGFTKTDPSYGSGWNVIATPNSVLTDLSDGTTYPYLFWEGNNEIKNTPQEGFVVAQSDIPALLTQKLALFGLNAQERADFLAFWLPHLSHAPYYFITFIPRSEIDSMAPLFVTPQPDTIIRVLMDYKPLDTPISVVPLPITPTAREGFTVVEWGGIIR